MKTLSLERKNATNHSDCQNLNQLQYAVCYNLMKSTRQELQQIETQAESWERAELNGLRILHFQKKLSLLLISWLKPLWFVDGWQSWLVKPGWFVDRWQIWLDIKYIREEIRLEKSMAGYEY